MIFAIFLVSLTIGGSVVFSNLRQSDHVVPRDAQVRHFGDVSSEARKAAIDGLPNWIDFIPDLISENDGISDSVDLALVKVGEGYPVNTVVSFEMLADYTPGEVPSSYFTSSRLYYFSITTGGAPIVDITVDWHENRWQIVGGGGFVTKELYNLEKDLPSIAEEVGLSADYSLSFVEIFPLNAYFVLIESGGSEYAFPLDDFYLKSGQLYPAEDLMLLYAVAAQDVLEKPDLER
jgi:hypothetical protein